MEHFDQLSVLNRKDLVYKQQEEVEYRMSVWIDAIQHICLRIYSCLLLDSHIKLAGCIERRDDGRCNLVIVKTEKTKETAQPSGRDAGSMPMKTRDNKEGLLTK